MSVTIKYREPFERPIERVEATCATDSADEIIAEILGTKLNISIFAHNEHMGDVCFYKQDAIEFLEAVFRMVKQEPDT